MTLEQLKEEFLSKWSKTFDTGTPYWPDREAIADWWLSKLTKTHTQAIEETIEIVKNIDVSGGGSGRRIQIQLLEKLEELKDKE